MIDFTLKSYAEYGTMIKHHFDHILTFEEYFSWNKGLNKFCIIRHDVDRKPENALKMAVLEHELISEKQDRKILVAQVSFVLPAGMQL